MKLRERINILLDEAVKGSGLKKTPLLQKGGINIPNFTSALRGERPFSDTMLEEIANSGFFKTTLDQLKAWRAMDEYTPEQIQEAAALLSKPEKIDGLYRIPLKGTVAAGSLTYLSADEEESYVDWYAVPEFSADLFALRVQGNSMAPHIPDGSILIVRQAKGFIDKGIYVIETEDNESTVKAVQYNGTGTRLVPLNDDHRPFEIRSEKIRRIYEVLEHKVNWQGKTVL